MEDRFKFRVWDKENKVLVEVLTLDFMHDEIWHTHMIDIPKSFDKCVIQQCIGLKDKNGKLIYEGDIFKQGKEFYKIIIATSNNYGSTVKAVCRERLLFKGDYSVLEIESEESDYARDDNNVRRIEIIGNIYENPELLENNDKQRN